MRNKRVALALLALVLLAAMCAPGSALHAEDEMPILLIDYYLPAISK